MNQKLKMVFKKNVIKKMKKKSLNSKLYQMENSLKDLITLFFMSHGANRRGMIIFLKLFTSQK